MTTGLQPTLLGDGSGGLEPSPPMPDVAGVSHHWITVNGVRLHYAEAGQGPALMLLHGWPQHWWAWRHLIGPLSENYRVICPDIRGMGWSEGAARTSSLHVIARDIITLLDQLGIDKFQLVGHDWGLVAGYRTCLNWPDRVERFVGLGGVHPWARADAPLRLWFAPWHIYAIALIGDPASRQLISRCLRVWRQDGQFTDSERRTYLSAMHTQRCLQTTRDFDRNVVLREVPHFALHASHMRLRVPTLLLNGDHDPLTKGLPHSYRDHTDDCRLELVPDCGHFIAEEQPTLLLGYLDGFLNPDY
jgi:pimeloyl-ACP methyl ester carboxylesterase